MGDWKGRVVLEAPDGTIYSRPLPVIMQSTESQIAHLRHIAKELENVAEDVGIQMLHDQAEKT